MIDGKPELLAPAGGWEQLKYAIRFGADAVYLATDRFNLRQRADNFSLEELPMAVDYAHSHGVSVHVTLNAQMHEADFEDLPRYMQVIDSAGVDAVLVSDLGALRCARQNAPHTQIHVSTQASVSNAQSALTWYELGATRVVCAREMSLEDLAVMRKMLPSDMEMEVFVHGAMCMAISGRCLISDYLTGRSAVAGNCTQPCRWSFTLEEEKRPGVHFPIEEDGRGSYILNAKDMNMLAHLDKLTEIGIDSIKIEGRNKKAFYVATVVNAYRQVLDGADSKLFERELETVSHRPYGTGFFFGPAHQTPQTDAYVRPYDWAVEVISSEACEEGWRVLGFCRNRFWKGSKLEILAPGEPIRSFAVRDLMHVPEYGVPVKVDVANRAMDRYSFISPFPLKEFYIARVLRQEHASKPVDDLEAIK